MQHRDGATGGAEVRAVQAPDASAGPQTARTGQGAADRLVDARGAFCPGPLMELIKAIRGQAVGSVVEVWSSDHGSARDIPQWAHKAGHELVYVIEEPGYWRIGVRKGR